MGRPGRRLHQAVGRRLTEAGHSAEGQTNLAILRPEVVGVRFVQIHRQELHPAQHGLIDHMQRFGHVLLLLAGFLSAGTDVLHQAFHPVDPGLHRRRVEILGRGR